VDEHTDHQRRSRLAYWAAVAAVLAVVAGAAVWITRDEPSETASVVDAGQAGVEADSAGHWARVEAPFGGQRAERVVTLKGGVLLAAVPAPNGEIAVWRSDDAGTWNQSAVLRADTTPDSSADLSLSSADGWVFVATRGGLWRSADGYGWIEVSDAGIDPGAMVHDVVSHRGGFVAVGSVNADIGAQPVAWTSADGSTWTRSDPIPIPDGYGVDGEGNGALHAVASDGTTLVAVGTRYGYLSNATWTSGDGRTWLAGERPAEDAPDQAAEILDVAWTGEWLAAGVTHPEGSGLWSSADGTSWTRETADPGPSPAGRFTRLVDLDVGTVALEQHDAALESHALWLSDSDGTWRPISLPDGIKTLPVRDIAAFDQGLVAVGHDVWIWSPGAGPTEPVPVTTTLDPTQPTLATVPPNRTGVPPMGSLGSPAPDLPPFDAENEVEQAIIDAVYAAFGGGPYIKGDHSRFEGDMSEAFDEAVEQYPQHAEGIAAAVYEVTLLNESEAEVVFDVIDDDVLVTATTRGRVILVDGTWVVAQATICEMMARGGLRCP
jgi:hypothetical protein